MPPTEHLATHARASVPTKKKTGTPAPGLARGYKHDKLSLEERAEGMRRRLEADALVRPLIQIALARTGVSSVGRRLGVSRTLARGWGNEGGLAMALRDVLAAPRTFARDVLEAALLAVAEDVPETTEDLERLASRLLRAACALAHSIEDTRGQPDSMRRRVVLAIVEAIEDRCRQLRAALTRPTPAVPPPPPSCPSAPDSQP